MQMAKKTIDRKARQNREEGSGRGGKDETRTGQKRAGARAPE